MQNKIKATKPSIIVKARIKFAHALKKDAQHSRTTPGFNNPHTRGEGSQGVHEDSGWPDSIQKLKTWVSVVLHLNGLLTGALHSSNNAISSVSDKCK